ncbi:hypothetical protein PsAD5_02614 [Pseudovibrio sp. Ad5]|uniref:hypothetical protein n=1 Tax=Pseudovibrio sp. Ad5 TaxID=989436 RepID=UPI0007AE4C11|nr:hypothetical protein [Pseudovibrio sp. Ad5]KZK96421.1 hypothetical protein PsAD5_02614 [Pseudovibrio sp. Ad5]
MPNQHILVNQKTAAEMLGVSVTLFKRLRSTDHRLMPAVIPETKGEERYYVPDLEQWAHSLKYPHTDPLTSNGGMWDDQSAA